MARPDERGHVLSAALDLSWLKDLTLGQIDSLLKSGRLTEQQLNESGLRVSLGQLRAALAEQATVDPDFRRSLRDLLVATAQADADAEKEPPEGVESD